jgi:nitrite reductase (NADH) small subunit
MIREASELMLCPVTAIPPGEGRAFDVAGMRVAVFRSRSGDLFATQAECPHRGGPLADGLLGGKTLICPLHAWKFDLSTGDALAGECRLETYPVRVDDAGQVMLTLEPT